MARCGRSGAAGRSQVQHRGGQEQQVAACPALGRNSLGQRDAAGCGNARAGSAGRRHVQHGCRQVQHDAASRFIRRKQLAGAAGCGGVQTGAAACRRVPHGCSSRCRRVQEDAAGPLRGGSSLGYSGVQPGVAERGQGQLGAARCSQVQQGGAAVCRQVRHGCSRAQPGAAECSRSLSTRKQLTKSKKCVALGENSSQSDQTAKYSS